MKNRLFALTFVAGVSIASSVAAQTPAAPAAPEAAQRRSDEAPATTPTTPVTSPTPSGEAQSPTPAAAPTTDAAPAQDSGEAMLTSTPGSKALGISILGNQEAPTSLVIVPWKSSELGNSLGNSPMLDDSRQPVDKDVFMRALRYYEIRSEPAGHGGMTTGGRENAAVGGSTTQPSAARRR